MSKLKAIKPTEVVESKPKILVFGRAGVGKTWTSLDFPACYYIDTEDGASRKQYMDKLTKSGGVYFGVEQGSLDFATVIEQVKALATEEHSYKTLVIDSFTQLFGGEIAKQTEKMIASGYDMTKTYGAEKKPAVSHSRQLINWLQKIDMNVILICHEKIDWADTTSKPGQQAITYDGWDKAEFLLDLVINVKKIGDEARKAYVKKSRITAFPDASNFNWSYNDFAEKYGKSIIEGEVKQIELAGPEQLKTLEGLREVVKLSDDWQDKIFSKFKVESFDELSSSDITKIIEALSKQLTTLTTKGA